MSTPAKKAFDLPTERPSSIDEKGARVYVHPAEASGKWRTRRTLFYSVLLVIFLVLPWIRINGAQALLLDVGQRRFAVFGLTFWAHDAPILLFVIGGFALSLLFVTSVWGRVWCGWACPQTVFIDMVFRRIEGWVEGNANARRKLDKAPWDAAKVSKRTVKWVLFTIVSLVIAHSFLAYFVGTDRLMHMVVTSPAENMAPFLVMVGATGLVLFDFGWFREQFCIVACPYGRLQSVLMDDKSMAPLYDPQRGEPRKFTPGIQPDALGDCVDCFRCVQVCPTGIDIRRGLQMECVACTACIDACDTVMDKVKKPRGLIRYASVQSASDPKVKRTWGPRSVAYLGLILACAIGLFYSVSSRQLHQMTVNRPPDAPYSVAGDGKLVNHLRVHYANQTFDEVKVMFEVDGLPSGYEVVTAKRPLTIPAGKSMSADIFVMFDSAALTKGKRKVILQAVDKAASAEPLAAFPVELLGPSR
jgi:cytochrome c oxidase accessory protein FixG